MAGPTGVFPIAVVICDGLEIVGLYHLVICVWLDGNCFGNFCLLFKTELALPLTFSVVAPL